MHRNWNSCHCCFRSFVQAPCINSMYTSQISCFLKRRWKRLLPQMNNLSEMRAEQEPCQNRTKQRQNFLHMVNHLMLITFQYFLRCRHLICSRVKTASYLKFILVSLTGLKLIKSNTFKSISLNSLLAVWNWMAWHGGCSFLEHCFPFQLSLTEQNEVACT